MLNFDRHFDGDGHGDVTYNQTFMPMMTDTLMGWLGLEPIRPIKVPVIIGTMLNFDGHFDGDGHGDVTCEQSFRCEHKTDNHNRMY